MEHMTEYYKCFQDFIGYLILCFLAVVTFFDILDHKGINIPWFSAIQRKREKDNINYIKANTYQCISQIFTEDHNLLMQYKDERIRQFLAQLGLNSEQFEQVKYEIIKLRKSPPMDTWENIRKRLEHICISDFTLINQKGIPSVLYNAVNYYVNLTDIMFDNFFAYDLVSMMVNLIESSMDERELSKIDKIVVTTEGNFLLGLKVAERMKKPFVKMRENPKIRQDQYWDGKLNSNENIIFVHDVLVKAEQVIKSINKFPSGINILAFFCLVHRSEWRGLEKLKALNINVYSILTLSDEYIENLLMSRGEE